MARFLSDDWCAGIAADAPGADDVGIEITVLGGPDGDVKWQVAVAGGTVSAAAGPRPGAEVSLTVPYDDMVAILRGELQPSVAFMRGTMKTAGDQGALLVVLAATATTEFAAQRASVATSTEVEKL
jgi:putative sterol carrier protein